MNYATLFELKEIYAAFQKRKDIFPFPGSGSGKWPNGGSPVLIARPEIHRESVGSQGGLFICNPRIEEEKRNG
jgi:hypothetical protein